MLVEDQEIIGEDLAGAVCSAELRENIEFILDRKNVKAALGQLLADFSLSLSRLQLLKDVAGRISDFTYILAHEGIDGPLLGTS